MRGCISVRNWRQLNSIAGSAQSHRLIPVEGCESEERPRECEFESIDAGASFPLQNALSNSNGSASIADRSRLR